jgi:hypothetical protein
VSVQKFPGDRENDRPYDVRFRERQDTIGLWRRLHDLGFNVIPSHPLSKVTSRCWEEYQMERQTRWQFHRWFLGDYRLPGTSEAMLVVGDTPGIKVVVLDGDDTEAVALIQDRCPPTPMMVKTRRGYHFYYAHPGTGRIRQRTKTRIGGVTYAIDLKADGSVVVAPGSRHENGNIYEMTQMWTPAMVDGLPVFDPNWLPHEEGVKVKHGPPSAPAMDTGAAVHQAFANQDWLPPVGQRKGRAYRYLARVPGTQAGEGTARYECFRLALILAWGFALPSEEAIECLLVWGRKEGNTDRHGAYYPWSEHEIDVEVRSASTTPYWGKPGDKLFGAETPGATSGR